MDSPTDAAVDSLAVDACGDASTTQPCRGARPDSTNTGVPASVPLPVLDHDVTITVDGTVLDAQDIHGFLTIKASGVRASRSIVRGRATTTIIRIDSGSAIVRRLLESTAAGCGPRVRTGRFRGWRWSATRIGAHEASMTGTPRSRRT